uniref:Ig-like domain-containing protein n=1 Tax=Anabas testudineus TaxID=64144 RepID=A0A7N6BQ34_ANATE
MHQMNRLSIPPQLRTTSVLVVHLLLIHFTTGQSKLIGSSQPIVATVGDDIILPCHLEPAVDVAAKTLEWTRSDLEPRFVFVWRAGQDFVTIKNPSYKGRTSLFTDELKHGNISLKLSEVKPADEGKYRCYVPDNNEESFVELVVASAAAASPVITLERIDRDEEGVILQCESKGWYPEPELLWLDAEGKILSAGPTETVRGPDDLYTVSSRVTVEKRHSNNIICRVQQSNINQIRETQIHISDDFCKVQSISPLTAGFAVIVVICIILLLLLVFVVWKRKLNKTNDKEMNKPLKSLKPEEQGEGVHLMTNETVIEGLDNGQEIAPAGCSSFLGKLLTVSRQKFDEEKKKREEAEKEVQTLNEELKNTKEQVNQLKTEVQKHKEEKQRSEDQRQQQEKELETKKQEGNLLTAIKLKLKGDKPGRAETEKEVQITNEQVNPLMTDNQEQRSEDQRQQLEKELEFKIKELKDQVEAEEKKRKDIEDKMEELKKKSKKQNKKEADTLKIKLEQITELKEKLQTEEKKMKDKVEPFKKQLEDIEKKFEDLVNAEEKRKKEVEALKKQLEIKITELQNEKKSKKDVEIKQLGKTIIELKEKLQPDDKRMEKVKTLMKQLDEICKKLPAEEQNKMKDTGTLMTELEKKNTEVEPQELNDISQTGQSSVSVADPNTVNQQATNPVGIPSVMSTQNPTVNNTMKKDTLETQPVHCHPDEQKNNV